MILQLSIIAIVSVSTISYWEFVQIPEHNKLSEFYILDQEYIGQNQIADNVHGELSQPFLLHDTMVQEVIEDGDELRISSVVSSKKAATGETLFYVENTYHVDSKTRMHLDKEGKLFGFPPGVEKRDYDFFHPAVFFDDPMMYVETNEINGLEVYIFETVTKNKDVSFAFSQFAPHTIHTDTTSRLWVEPITGNVVNFEKIWENYLIENGQRSNTIEVGGKPTSEFNEHILVEATISQIENMYFNNVLMPSLILTVILITGLVWILSSYSNRIKQERIQLEQKNKLKDELVSMLSHEIKNPLTPIKNICELLLLEKDGNLNEKQRERIQAILKNSNVLNELLSDFADVKKIDLEQVPLSKIEVDVKEYLETVLETVRPFAGEKNIKLSLNLKTSWKMNCDQKRISQVISNLVKNAIDFVPQGRGQIIISAELTREGTVISVTDNGIGISSENAEIIFDKFKQLNFPSYIRHEGSGLGLSVCKGIVEAHGGRIWLDKSYDAGANFKFLIP